MNFWLGTHKAIWLERTEAPLFVSTRTLAIRKTLPPALGPWALDSGGFTELGMNGRWETSPSAYVEAVRRYEREIGNLAWVSPQDWMCEPAVLKKTGRTVEAHQWLTVANFLRLRQELGRLVVPVLQGWERDDYLRCVDLYAANGVDLEAEPLVGLGSVCRRQRTDEAARIVRDLAPIALHGYGVKMEGLRVFGDDLVSADSMAWSYSARKNFPLRDCRHQSCSNCLRYALRWRDRVLETTAQLRFEDVA